MNKLLWIDTSFLYALFVQSDTNHQTARALWQNCIARRIQGVTSNLIVSEFATLLAYRFNHRQAVDSTRTVLASNLIRKVYADNVVESGALGWLMRYEDQRFSFPDCVSFQFMKLLGMRRACG